MQGAYQKHLESLKKIGAKPKEVRCANDLEDCKGLIIPGGESTVISKLSKKNDFWEKVLKYAKNHAIMGTCAGAIMMSKNAGDERISPLELIDMDIERNSYGSQIDSFKTSVKIEMGERKNFNAIFIRAPKIKRIGESVECLAEHEGHPIMVKQNNFMATTFHPELSEDATVHEYFLTLCGK